MPVALHRASGTPPWSIPTQCQCLECHTPSAGGFLGLIASQLNRDVECEPGEPRNQLDRWSLRTAVRVVTVSVPFREELIRQGVRPERILIVHNAIDP